MASNDSGVLENGNFQRFHRLFFFENFRDEASVYIAIRSPSQSVVGFSVIPKCVTLNGYFVLKSALSGSDRAVTGR